jgi:hypothetical protein
MLPGGKKGGGGSIQSKLNELDAGRDRTRRRERERKSEREFIRNDTPYQRLWCVTVAFLFGLDCQKLLSLRWCFGARDQGAVREAVGESGFCG